MYKRLLRPFSYLSIKHDSKWRVDWLYPFILASVSLFVVLTSKFFGEVVLFAENGLIERTSSFIQTLPGFYLAGLAIVATLQKGDIDKTMPTPAPQLKITVSGKKGVIKLTRRRFLCLLFAFLTAESLLLVGLNIFFQIFHKSLKVIIPEFLQSYVSYVLVWMYLLLFWQLILATLWSLFYLGERIHLPDP
jgi:hypothetical protein